MTQKESNILWGQSKTAKTCAVCKIIKICPACHQHRFPPDEAKIAESDKLHGKPQPGCACSDFSKTRRQRR